MAEWSTEEVESDAESRCESCGASLWGFQESCPYCGDDGLEDELPCTSCGAMISEFAEQCPKCGDWIASRLKVEEEGRQTRKIAILLLLVFLGAALFWFFGIRAG